MTQNKLFLLFSILVLTLSSCETDVDLFTEHGEKPVVFAMLEPAHEWQYFRINPSFIGEGDARTVAGDPKITNYDHDEISVKLFDLTSDKEYLISDSLGLIDLDNDGIFDVKNRIYFLHTPRFYNPSILDSTNSILIAGHEYQLWIKHNTTKAITTSTITLGDIHRLRMATPEKGNSQKSGDFLNFYGGAFYNTSYTFEFDADVLSERFLISAKFYYSEYQAGSSDSVNYHTDFDLGEKNEVPAYTGLKRIQIDFNGEKFYSILANKLSPFAARTGQTFDLILTAVGSDLDTYLSVQNASLTGLSQEVPSYSNIENGLGVFSYRFNKTFKYFKLNQTSAVHLFESSYTFELFNCARFGSSNSSLGVVACR